MDDQPDMVGAMPPPPGVVPDFVSPVSRAKMDTILHAICLAVVTVFLVLRIYTRKFISRWLSWDDYMCLLVYALTIAFSALQMAAHTHGFGRHLWDVPASELPKVLKILMAAELLYLPLVAFVKLTFLFFFERLFSSSKPLRWLTRFGMVSCVIIYTSTLFRAIFICSPVEKAWNPAVPGRCFPISVMAYVTGIFNVISDFYILLLPMPLLWKLQMDMHRKVRLMLIFGVGFIACVASIIRLVVTVQTISDPDITWRLSTLAFWTVLEVNVGILCACSFAFPAFFDRHCPHLGWYVSRLSSYLSIPAEEKRRSNRETPAAWPRSKRSVELQQVV